MTLSHLRWAIAEMLISWAVCAAPECDAKLDLLSSLIPWWRRQGQRILKREV